MASRKCERQSHINTIEYSHKLQKDRACPNLCIHVFWLTKYVIRNAFRNDIQCSLALISFKPSERRYPCTKSPAFTNSACCSIVHFCGCNTHVSAGCQRLRLPCICIIRCCNTHVSAGCQSVSFIKLFANISCNTHVSAGCQRLPNASREAESSCNTHVSAGCQCVMSCILPFFFSCNTHVSVLLTFKDVSLLREDKRKPSEAQSPRVFYSTFANTAKKDSRFLDCLKTWSG